MSFTHQVEIKMECDVCGGEVDDVSDVACRECYKKVEEDKGELETRVDELEEQVGSLEGDCSDLQDEIDKLKDKLGEADDTIIELEAQLKKAKSIDDILGVLDHYDMKDKASQMPESGGGA